MLLDNDAYVHDAYICDIQSLTMLHVCLMRLKFCDQPTDQPTDKAILGVACREACIYDACMCDACQKMGTNGRKAEF